MSVCFCAFLLGDRYICIGWGFLFFSSPFFSPPPHIRHLFFSFSHSGKSWCHRVYFSCHVYITLLQNFLLSSLQEEIPSPSMTSMDRGNKRKKRSKMKNKYTSRKKAFSPMMQTQVQSAKKKSGAEQKGPHRPALLVRCCLSLEPTRVLCLPACLPCCPVIGGAHCFLPSSVRSPKRCTYRYHITPVHLPICPVLSCPPAAAPIGLSLVRSYNSHLATA